MLGRYIQSVLIGTLLMTGPANATETAQQQQYPTTQSLKSLIKQVKISEKITFDVRPEIADVEIDVPALSGDAFVWAITNKFNHAILTAGGAKKIFLLSLIGSGNINTSKQPQKKSIDVTQANRDDIRQQFSDARVSFSRNTDFVRFIGTGSGQALPDPLGSGYASIARSLAFLDENKSAFLPAGQPLQLSVKSQVRDSIGIDHVRFKQHINDIPVFAGDVIVHLNHEGIVALNATLLPETENLNPHPTIDKVYAQEIALTKVEKALPDTVGPTAKQTRLEYFNHTQLGEDHPSLNTLLTWFVDVQGPGVRQYVWVDADNGRIVKSIDQLTEAKNRKTFDSHHTNERPGILRRTEGQPDIQNIEIDNAHNFAGDAYDYYFTYHGRDSFDNNGATIISSVNFCPDPASCPFANAFWDGVQMTYGQGFAAADDVVAHELTHAITERTAGLVYLNESGALNESFSDVFGESVDLLNFAGNDDASVRWELGEDIPVFGTLRHMLNPNILGDPDKVSDPLYFCGTADNGGVHTNTGVPNHAFALLVDGGTFNGFNIQGIDLIKAGKVYYRALTLYLPQTSTFLDAFNSTNQACTDLINTNGITAGDCVQVSNALQAVEMDVKPCFTPPHPPLPLCQGADQVSQLFSDDLENTHSGAFVLSGDETNHWSGGIGNPNIYHQESPRNGLFHLLGDNLFFVADASVEMTQSVMLPPNARLQFEHYYDIEAIFDGGVIEFSTDDGQLWLDAGNLITLGRNYVGTIDGNFQNPLAGRPAFTGTASGYASTQLDLSSLAGQSVRFRWRLGTDITIGNDGWYVDDITLYHCIPERNDDTEIRRNAILTFIITL